MFIIPCKYTKKSNIFELIESINKFHPNEKILICDSESDDKSYLDNFSKYENIEKSFENKGYVDSAIWKAYNDYPEEDFFFIIHDSMLLYRNLDSYKNFDFTSYMHFDGFFDNPEQKNYIKNNIEKTNFEFREHFTGLFGITFFCKRFILDSLKKKGLDKIIPSNKNQMCGSERIWGMCLEQIGIDIKMSSVVGEYTPRPKSKILGKNFLNRN
jgi:hypothetical protein